VLGAVLRTRAKVKPIYVSVGHRISLTSAIEVVLRCTPRYRLPETTRQAHSLASGRTWLQSPGDLESPEDSACKGQTPQPVGNSRSAGPKSNHNQQEER
jgi:hypothetical protein